MTVQEIKDTLKSNLERVESLLIVYQSHPNAKGSGRKKTATLDTLRAAVVLLHASLEEVLRSVAHWKLPGAANTVLDGIAFVGNGPNPKKVFLGALADHRGRTVDEVIQESVDEHLAHSNYNDTEDIATLMKQIAIDVTKVNQEFAQLEKLMSRRHQIVHRADRTTGKGGKGHHSISSIGYTTVEAWLKSVRAFSDSLFAVL